MRHFVTYARRAALVAAILIVAALVAGCETLSLTMLGIGGSAAVNHKLSGIPARTFTVPLVKVKTASIGALKRMGITAEDVKKIENGELITARLGKRQIEVELESLTAQTTRMRVVARNGSFFYDGATASEIIVQTEKSLGV
jgi:predicted small secreted protein